MATMSRYCKAYPVTRLRAFPALTIDETQLERPKELVDGEEVELPRTLSDDDYFFVHDNFVVTDSVFVDEHVLFDAVTPEWMQFCTDVLEFKVPDDALDVDAPAGAEEASAASAAPNAPEDATSRPEVSMPAGAH
jgi:hypothetical protein